MIKLSNSIFNIINLVNLRGTKYQRILPRRKVDPKELEKELYDICDSGKKEKN